MTKNNAEFEDIQKASTLLRNIGKLRRDSRYDAALDSLYSVIDTLQRNTTLDYISNYWNELTLWQKLLGGIAVSGLPLALGAVANISFFMKIAGVNATAYALSWWLLEDHNQCIKNTQNRCISAARDVLFFAARGMEIPLEDLNFRNDKVF